MSQLFDTPEDPWALPSPKRQEPWGASIQDQGNDDPLQSNPNQEDDDMATSPPQATTVSRLSPPIQQPQTMEGSIWGGDDAILGNPNSSSRTMALSDNADLDNDTTSGMAEFHQWSEAVRKTYSAITPDVIFISELPEKEGLLFKHTNYLIEHHVPLELDSTNSESSVPGERKVIRRYSDFVWLLEVLHKRYTFRLVPELPPKKLASSSDPLFLERRRRGLARFLNALVRHPVLRREQLVIMFLTVPTDLSGWRRQAQYDTSEEFVDRKSSPQFVKMWNSSKKELDAMMFSAEEELKNALENWNKKLAEIQDKPDVRGADVDRLTDSIIADRKEIARQTNRDWLIKENILSEFVVFQESQFQITRVMKLWVSDRLKFAEQNMDNWTGLSSVLQDMPLSRAD
ncbi:Sorting nexin MVP1 [Cyberlindnera fabianii]|uniref:Sorting nexin MVP1 n=1 Tax=Cyberlindnera fabianii TaxID=36022 RepID=A0A1V2L6U1_CYBFA|nr:Sorting nexin MVP1 [Cyberlindnera fabianii]